MEVNKNIINEIKNGDKKIFLLFRLCEDEIKDMFLSGLKKIEIIKSIEKKYEVSILGKTNKNIYKTKNYYSFDNWYRKQRKIWEGTKE